MDISVVNEDSDSTAFKSPHNLDLKESKNIETLDSENNVSSDVKKSEKPESNKTSKNRVDVPLPYKEPEWCGLPPPLYSFEIIKNGTFLESYNIRTSLVVFGRLDVCNIAFEHPSVSRYHAVLQYCAGDSTHPKGFYIYDLGSTHGTFLNKEKITPKIYYKLKIGYILKFGGSTRLHIFQGPEEEETEADKELTPTKIEEDICNWGMGEDAEEEDDLSENPFALSTPNEELYLDDPKKTLKNWFEREGCELEYEVEEKGFKTFVCRIQLPVDTPTGDFMPIEASVSGKKKEAVVACALEACRTLDRLGLLRQSHQESRQKKKKKWEENDYYDSDEDTFLDRTGTIEKKREMRKRSEKKTEAETFQTIESKLKVVIEEINEISKKLAINKSDVTSEKNSEDDTLEAYMCSLSDSKEMASDKIERRKLRYRLQEAEKERAHLEKLLDIARPAKLPSLVKHPGMIGKKLKCKLKLPKPKPEETFSPITKLNENEEEIDDSDTEIRNVCNSPKKDDACVASPVKTDSGQGILDKDTENVNSYGLILNITKKDEEKSLDSKEKSYPVEEQDEFSKKRVVGCEKPDAGDVAAETVLPLLKKKKKEKQPQSNVDVYTVGNSEYSTWVPPTGQTGDGMTHLNAKYGY